MDHRLRHLLAPRPRLFPVLGLAVVTIVALGIWATVYGTDRTANLRELAEAVGPHRVALGRFTGGFVYDECVPKAADAPLVHGLVCEQPPPTQWPSSAKLRQLAGRLHQKGVGATSEYAHTLGIWNVVWGRPREGVEDLQSVTRHEPGNAGAQNDLAVALMSLAEATDDPSLLIDAWTAADSALRLDRSLQEARFTYAILQEMLYLRDDAVAAWESYLEVDSRSSWAAEARARLAGLQAPAARWSSARERLPSALAASDDEQIQSIVTQFPSQTRMLVEDSLGAWGDAVRSARASNARQILDVARVLSGALRVVTGDAMLRDAVAVIDGALSRNDDRQVRELAEGHSALRTGVAFFDSLQLAEAGARLSVARRLLASAGSPMAGWAQYYLACIASTRGDGQSAQPLLRGIRDSTRSEYLVLRSFSAKMAGFLYDIGSDYVRVVAAYDSAAAEGRTTREPEIDLRLGSWLAPKATILRGRQAGWRVLYASLTATRRYPENARGLHAVFSSAALETGNDEPRLSLRYFDQASRIARTFGDSRMMAGAFARHAEQLAQMRQFAQAQAAVDSSFRMSATVRDQNARAQLVSGALLARGRVALLQSPGDAEAALEKVVEDYRASGYGRELNRAYLLLAEARLAAKHVDAARSAFDSAMALTELQRASVQMPDERTSFLDNARAVIDQILAFRGSHDDPKEAFDFFERTRSRVLLEQLTERRVSSPAHAAGSDPTVDAQRRLPKNAVVLSYAVLPSETLLWIVSRDRVEMRHIPVRADNLGAMVQQLGQSLGQPEDEAQFVASSERLYKVLIEPVGQLAPEARLVIIPDQWLHSVPFAALRSQSTGRYLVQDHEVSYAPSMALLGATMGRGIERTGRFARVLALGNPAFDASTFHLPDLPAAEREARDVARSYRGASILLGREATDAAFASLAPSFDVLHFAGHAVVRLDAPRLSYLLLASDGQTGGAVFSSAIGQWNLSQTKLVVLSGCSTSGGRLSPTEGASSLARAFFAAGVPAVIASLWAIEDEGSAKFFVAFHQRLAQGEPPAAALRATQLEWIARRGGGVHSASEWAAFQLFGG